MPVTLPSIDTNLCGQWTSLDIDYYNKLPFYLEAAKSEYRKNWSVWRKMLGTTSWKPNQGDTMKRVMVENAPVLRQTAYPNLLRDRPKMDIFNVRERTTTMQIRWQKFRSPMFGFLPSFQDFMKGNIKPTTDNINRQVSIFEDMFYRTHIWNWSPYVYVVGVGLVVAPQGETPDDTAQTGKYPAWIQAQVTALMGVQGGHLTLEELFKALCAAETDIGMTPYEGPGTPGGESSPLQQRFALIQSSESWNQFVNDPWVKENRPLNMNLVTESFKGDLFGKIRSKLEPYPLRYAVSDNGAVTEPAPETIQENEDRDDHNRTYPNPTYALPANSPVELAWLIGGNSYSRAENVTPPAEFRGDGGMDWSGTAKLTKNFLVPCEDGDGNTQMETNDDGEFLRLKAAWAGGIVGDNKFNVLPILFKRKRGITTVIPG